jgi:SNF2 family DNA or RNA helicase
MDLPHVDTAIFIDIEWSSILMQQALDRIHRINIENVKHTYYLRCKGTNDTLLHEALNSKWSTKELAERFLAGKQYATAND